MALVSHLLKLSFKNDHQESSLISSSCQVEISTSPASSTRIIFRRLIINNSNDDDNENENESSSSSLLFSIPLSQVEKLGLTSHRHNNFHPAIEIQFDLSKND